MTSIPPSLERTANLQGDHPNSAHYALAALRAEVGQLSAKAFCTARATEAAERAYAQRLHDLISVQAATTGAKNRLSSLDAELAYMHYIIANTQKEVSEKANCIEQARQGLQQIRAEIESRIEGTLKRFGISG